MLEQYSFPDFDSASPSWSPAPEPETSRRTERYFFALPVPPESRPILGALTTTLACQHGLLGRPVAPEHLHATLLSLGDYDIQQPELVAEARKFAASLHARPFEVIWDRVMSFSRSGRKRPLVLCGAGGVEGVARLQALFHRTSVERGIAKSPARKFTPHVTLLYDQGSVEEQAIPPVGWRAQEFLLVHSLLGQRRHVVLGRWALRG